MASVREFTLPDLGEGLTEATVVRWLVAVGDVVAVDQPVVEVETAKALVDVPCPYGGVVTARYGEEGAEMPVGAPLLTVAVGAAQGPAQEAAEPAAAPAGGTSGEGPGHTDAAGGNAGTAAAGSSGNVLVGYGTGAPAGRRRRSRPVDGHHRPAAAAPAPPAALGAAPAAASGAGPVAGAAPAAAGSGPVAVISPLVRRIAREHDLDLRGVTGTGPDGLILRADVERAARSRAESAQPAARPGPQPAAQPARPNATPGVPETATRIPLTGFRGTVADKLSRSRREIPDATCWVDADATGLLAARREMNSHAEAHGATAPKVSLLALLARICTAALSRFPELNATVDTEAREVVRHSEVHLGFAAQTPRGLVVPVVRDAHTLDAVRLSEEFARLTECARAGDLKPSDMAGGTFTLNNYGVFGVDGSTPIINHPEAAMLGVGRIAEKPWVHEGRLAVRQVVQLSFTFDHRVCDGGTAGGFLRHVADCVEHPAVLLRTL